jgi:hypothetical protein
MQNNEDFHSEYYEELCALAAGGQISERELIELQDHLQQCGQCRSTYSDFVDLLHNKLPLADPDGDTSKLPGFFSKRSSYRERFLARARKEGIAVSNRPAQDIFWNKFEIWAWLRLGYAQVATLAVAALLVTVGLLGYRLYQSNIRYIKLASDRAAINTQSGRQSDVRRQDSPEANVPHERRVTSSTPDEPALHAALASPDNGTAKVELSGELAKERTDRAVAEARSKTLEEQLTQVSAELNALRAHSEQSKEIRDELEKKLKEAEQVANAVKDDLLGIRQARSKDSIIILAQDLQIQKLSEKLTAQAKTLEQEKALLEASRNVRDIMGARNFHIADVFDVDSKGKDQRAFGRVIVSEGKETLIFYAFDLNDRITQKRNASFQVWGQHGPKSPAYSLGLFQIDDQKLNRWVLLFEDPQILAKIDSVIVTVEPPGGSIKPTGRQFLFAYLNATPNHQ